MIIFDKVHYRIPRKYLKQELELRAGEKEIYVYNKNGDHIRTHKQSYTPKDWMIIPSDMPAEYKDYGYWNVPYFLQKAAAVFLYFLCTKSSFYVINSHILSNIYAI